MEKNKKLLDLIDKIIGQIGCLVEGSDICIEHAYYRNGNRLVLQILALDSDDDQIIDDVCIDIDIEQEISDNEKK